MLLWLALFLGVAATVVTRQSASFKASRQLGELRQERTALQARRAELERRIRELSSRRVLSDRAAHGLGLHEAADSELVFFPLPSLRRQDEH